MEIVIHGTKDGYRQLHSTNADVAYVIAKDMRIGTNDDGSMGQSVYSLGFFTSGLAYSKYIIVKDTQRSSALGFIAFTLFFEHNKTLEGSNIKRLLDELSESYSKKYIVNNYLNRGEKTLIREDWSFVKNISDNYNEQSRSINYQQKTGSKDPAIVYFNDTPELLDYLDRPYQEDYENFKQIFFLASNQKASNTNPVNVLRNSGQELNINLNNNYYKILNLDPTKKVIIRVNSKNIDANSLIRDNSDLEISYSTNDQLYETIGERGRLLDDKIKRYLSKERNGIRIKYEAFTSQIPKTKTITIKPKKEGDTYLNFNLKLTCKGSYSSEILPVVNNKINFKGEQINKIWEIKATGLNLHEEAKPIIITPLHQKSPIVLDIRKTKPPSKQNKYFLKKGKHGNFKKPCTQYSYRKDGSDLDKIIKPKRGYEFSHWAYDNDNFHLVAKYNKKKFNIRIILVYCFLFLISIYSIFLIITGTNGYFSNENKPNTSDSSNIINYTKITDYTNGNDLFLDSLNGFKRDLEKDKPPFSNVNFLYKFLSILPDSSTNYKSWTKIHTDLNSAINKREIINNKNFKALDSLKFSNNQKDFKNAINAIVIDTLNYERIVSDLGDVSGLGLNKIKDSISNILKKIDIQKEEDITNDEEEAQIAKTKKAEKDAIDAQEKAARIEADKKAKALRKELKRDNITKDELVKLEKTYPEFKKQINQYLEFFDLAISRDFDDFIRFKKSLINNKNNYYFENTPLLKFITEICNEDSDGNSNFKIYVGLSGRKKIKTLKELKNKYDEIGKD